MTLDALRLEIRVRLRDALAEVYAGADLDDVDALLDQMTDRGLRVADLAVHVCPPCPHIQTSDEGTSYCDLAESHAEVTRLREALDAARVELVAITRQRDVAWHQQETQF